MNCILLTTIALALSNPFIMGLSCNNNMGTTQAEFTNVEAQEVEQCIRVEGTLEPGKTLIGPKGISLTAPDNHDGTFDGIIRDSVKFYLETIEDPTTDFPFLQTMTGGIEGLYISDDFEVVSSFYKVGTVGPKTWVALSIKFFDVNITLPEGLTINDVAILVLGDAGLTGTDHDKYGLVWSNYFGIRKGPTPNQVTIAQSVLDSGGFVYVLVKTN